MRRTMTIGTRNMSGLRSILGGQKQDIAKIREKWDFSHKWVFLRKSGKDDLMFAIATVTSVGILLGVATKYYNMLNGIKIAK
jgi:hypothetical protein